MSVLAIVALLIGRRAYPSSLRRVGTGVNHDTGAAVGSN